MILQKLSWTLSTELIRIRAALSWGRNAKNKERQVSFSVRFPYEVVADSFVQCPGNLDRRIGSGFSQNDASMNAFSLERVKEQLEITQWAVVGL